PNSRQTLRICLNLKSLIDKLISQETYLSININSLLSNSKIIQLALLSCGGKGDGESNSTSRKYRASIIFCLLIVCKWYREMSSIALHDSEFLNLKAKFTELLGKKMIGHFENDEKYLFINMLCHRYVINLNSEDSEPINALELAVDMHSILFISSSGYQRCVKWLWRGWIVQSSYDPTCYVMYKDLDKISIRAHFSPERIKAPKYQNLFEIVFSLFYLILFSIVLNIHDIDPQINFLEAVYYLFTAGFILDEITKLYHIGYNYLGFWNAFNDTMYTIVSISFVLRIMAVLSKTGSKQAYLYQEVSYKILACAAPFMWTRLLLYLDAEKFVGAMIVVIQRMMKESILFFVLLLIIFVGFLQGFLGFDSADGRITLTRLVLHKMATTVIGGADFGTFERLAPPYSGILYYLFVFLISVILLNILGALYNSSYALIVANATNEYLALSAHKTLRYIRSPDEDLYIPPLNLIEFFCLTLPVHWWCPSLVFDKLNYWILTVLYSPFLVIIAISEIKEARRVQYNRFKGLADDANEVDTPWDLEDGYEDSYKDGSLIASSGIISNTLAINQELRNQREGENADPEFFMNLVQFNQKLNHNFK
ncbi:uncharacterized protein ASCRUDRAFT_18311, partial [Ascoidea rubescens DSM 1968]